MIAEDLSVVFREKTIILEQEAELPNESLETPDHNATQIDEP